MNLHVILAIFRRNFISYFSNPTGYVFICVFVLLSSFAAFWPNEFFNANLANLDQLNRYLPYILLVFIPAITMSIWADERRQGTDELLLTIPAGDFDVVMGKYLAAVAIYGVSILFSLVSNYLVLLRLGEPDLGLLLATYLGYFIVGLAMLAIGMVASFLTGNLTVGFILGAMFNAPLVFAESVPEWLGFVKRLSIADQFRDFSHGVISFASVGYFLAIVALMLYLSVILIGRRHWGGGLGAQTMVGHYATRILALIAVVVSLNVFLSRHDKLRADVTTEKLNSLAPESQALIKKLDPQHPVVIEYFVSPHVPESYMQTRLNLLSTLRELEALNSDKVKVVAHDVEPFSEEANLAEQQFGIRPVRVESRTRGAHSSEEVFMGVAFNCGLERIVIPFLNKGIPPEYEVVRSIATVSKDKRKKIGVLMTDARLYGQMDFQTFQQMGDEPIIDELKKQYELVQVDANNPITDKFDVLLAAQPSSLNPMQMENFIAAVRSGQPTAIFEDPLPFIAQDVPGTAMPKQPGGGMSPFQQRMPPEPKGDIRRLWSMLGVNFGGENVVWQDYNPILKFTEIPREWVFVDRNYPPKGKEPFNSKSKVSQKLQQVLFVFPGSVSPLNSSQLNFTALATTGDQTGLVRADQVWERSFMGRSRLNPQLPLLERATNDPYVMAAHITGKLKDDSRIVGLDETAADAAKDGTDINVILVADIDCMYGAFFDFRARGDDPNADFNFQFDNVPFVLNVLDVLAGDERFVEIRTRRPAHRTLSKVNEATADAREKAERDTLELKKSFEKARDQKQREFDELRAKLSNRTDISEQAAQFEMATALQAAQRELDTTLARLTGDRDRKAKQADRKLSQDVTKVQDDYKRWAVLLPPIPPLIVGFLVFFNRRAKEREGVSKARLR